MPSLADLTVKAFNGTTDVIYYGVLGAGGDNSPALFRRAGLGVAAAHNPELRVSSQFNGNRTARRVNISYTYPSIATGSDGNVNIVNRFNVSPFGILVPLGMKSDDVNEAAYQFGNLCAATLIKECMRTGYAAT
jgi:hypothetical protein